MGDEYEDDDFEDYDEDFEDDAEEDYTPSPVQPSKPGRATVAVGGMAQPVQVGGIGYQAASSRVPPPMGMMGQQQVMPNMMNVGGLANRFGGDVGDAEQLDPQFQSGFAPQRHFVAPPSNEARQIKEQRRARAKALRGVVQLKEVDFTLYEAPPLTPYELHTRHLSRHLHAKSSYTGSDNLHVGLQTEEIEVSDVGAQWPEDMSTKAEHAASESAQTESLLTANVGRLRRFLMSAGQVVETLCTENLMAAKGSAGAAGFNQSNSLPFSMRHLHIELPAALGERSAHDLGFDATGSSLVAAFGKPHGPLPHEREGAEKIRKRDAAALRRLATGGLLAQWRLYRAETPWAIMRCVGVPSVCLLPEDRPHLVFSGTEEGSIQLWNLREAGSSHPQVDLPGGDRIALRAPTYSSDCLASGAHVSPITQLATLPSAGEEAALSIASLELEGTLILWVVLESVELDHVDLGQAVGGKERLMRSGTLHLTDEAMAAAGGSRGGSLHGGGGNGGGSRISASRPNGTGRSGTGRNGTGGDGGGLSVLPTRCVNMAFIPTDPSRVLLATDRPEILQRSRYEGTPLSPEEFRSHGAQADSAGAWGIAFCPSSPSHFVAGRSDGSVSLYHVDDSLPLLTWTGLANGPLLHVEWSPSRPGVVWVMDADETAHMIDVTEETAKPVLSSPVQTGGGPPGAYAAADGKGEEARPLRTRMALDRQPGRIDGAAAAGQRLMAVTCRGSGGMPTAIEVHVLTDKCAMPASDESAKLAHFLDKL